MLDHIVGLSAKIEELKRHILALAKTDARVLILGENGSGKELVAQAIHHLSQRRDKPFVALNCSAIPDTLLESELFGHEKGAFTGAFERRAGKFELAEGGTLFLDEIGDMPFPMQAKLLRVLQNGTLERIGGRQTIKTNVRVLAATNKNLRKMIRRSRFREDLYHRIAVVPLVTPPLRERVEDIPMLVGLFLSQLGAESLRFQDEAIQELQAYSWPGNVRELHNIVERLAVFASADKPISANDVRQILCLGASTHVPERPKASRDTTKEKRKTKVEALALSEKDLIPSKIESATLSMDIVTGDTVFLRDGNSGIVALIQDNKLLLRPLFPHGWRASLPTKFELIWRERKDVIGVALAATRQIRGTP